ncbi:MAG: endonuclease domain-containing protein [Turneriella sp.]
MSLKEKSRRLRREMTPAEEIVWGKLRDHQLLGFQFRRQHPIKGKYILDFYCVARKLAIEIDGAIHDSKEVRQLDALRTKELSALGIRVVRFTNTEVMSEIDSVLSRIAFELNSPSPR